MANFREFLEAAAAAISREQTDCNLKSVFFHQAQYTSIPLLHQSMA
jgi:hypothetical protein